MSDELKKEEQNNEEQDIVATDEDGNPLKATKEIKVESVDDVVNEDETTSDQIKKLKEKLAICVKEKQEYLDGWQRAKAEYINARKRDQEANEQYLKFAKEDLVMEIVPVLDSFEMAFANKEAWEKVDKNWRIGVEHIHNQLLGVLKNNNVEEIAPLGQKFDPARDEAVEFEPVSEEKFDHIITKVIQKGYKLSGKIIKAPKVKVGEFKKA